MNYSRFYDRTHERPPGTTFTPEEALELADQIERDVREQDGHGRDIVYVGSGETGVLIETLRQFAAMQPPRIGFALPDLCPHEAFNARVTVARLTDDEGALTGFQADIVVQCIGCGTEFVFLGVPAGVSLDQPCVQIDGRELRAPIAPSFAWVGPGKQLAARGFSVAHAPGSKSDA